MTEAAAGRIRACTISCHLDRFDDVVAAMETNFGPVWTDLAPEAAIPFLQEQQVELVVLCLSRMVSAPELLDRIVGLARHQGAKVAVVAREVGPALTQKLILLGCEMFLSNRLSACDIAAVIAGTKVRAAQRVWSGPSKVVVVTGLASGVGATMLAGGLTQEVRRLPNGPQARLVQPEGIRNDDADIHIVDLPPEAVMALRDIAADRLRWLVITAGAVPLPDLPVVPWLLRNRVSPMRARLANLRSTRALPEAGAEGRIALSGGLPLAEVAPRDRLRLSIRDIALRIVRTA